MTRPGSTNSLSPVSTPPVVWGFWAPPLLSPSCFLLNERRGFYYSSRFCFSFSFAGKRVRFKGGVIKIRLNEYCKESFVVGEKLFGPRRGAGTLTQGLVGHIVLSGRRLTAIRSVIGQTVHSPPSLSINISLD